MPRVRARKSANNDLPKKCPQGCAQWFDGCVTATCDEEGNITSLPEKHCDTYKRSRCRKRHVVKARRAQNKRRLVKSRTSSKTGLSPFSDVPLTTLLKLAEKDLKRAKEHNRQIVIHANADFREVRKRVYVLRELIELEKEFSAMSERMQRAILAVQSESIPNDDVHMIRLKPNEGFEVATFKLTFSGKNKARANTVWKITDGKSIREVKITEVRNFRMFGKITIDQAEKLKNVLAKNKKKLIDLFAPYAGKQPTLDTRIRNMWQWFHDVREQVKDYAESAGFVDVSKFVGLSLDVSKLSITVLKRLGRRHSESGREWDLIDE